MNKFFCEINNETIHFFSFVAWHTNTGNFNGKCIACGWKIKKGDTILVETDSSNGLNINKYCNTGCGNNRLKEYADYYKNLIKE